MEVLPLFFSLTPIETMHGRNGFLSFIGGMKYSCTRGRVVDTLVGSPIRCSGVVLGTPHRYRGIPRPVFFSARKFIIPVITYFGASYLRHQDLTGWTEVVSIAAHRSRASILHEPSLTPPHDTTTPTNTLSWDPTYSFESKMENLVPGTLAKRVCLPRIRTLRLISIAGMKTCSARSRHISTGEIGFPRRSFRCIVIRAWRLERQIGVLKGERRTCEFTRLICGEVMSAESIVISDVLRMGLASTSPTVHGTTRSTNTSCYIMYRIVQLWIGLIFIKHRSH